VPGALSHWPFLKRALEEKAGTPVMPAIMALTRRTKLHAAEV
jgi:hypothetical protein